MPTAHAKLSPSSAYRWIACPGCVAIEATLPDTSSPYAEEGTQAHSAAEQWLKKGKAPRGLAADMRDSLEPYISYVNSIIDEYKATGGAPFVVIEDRLDLSKYVPESFGTSDAVIICGDTLHVVDLKYGKGVTVEAEENPQLRLYALGAVVKYAPIWDIIKVKTHIVQPRLDHWSSEELSLEKLLSWAETVIKPAAEKATSDNAPTTAGDHCKFCKARAKCRACYEYNTQLYKDAPAGELTDLEVADLLERLSSMKSYLTAVEEHALAEALAGKDWPGFKLVHGRAVRKITDAESAMVALDQGGYKADDYAPRKLKTITELTKLLGKKEFAKLLDGFIEKPEGKPTLVPLSDKRESITITQTSIEDFKEK